MNVKCKTDRGRVREINEDYVLTLIGDRYYLLIVADGVGGSRGGEIASESASISIRDFVFENFRRYKDKEELVRDAMVNANKKVYSNASENDELSGMSTTITCALIVGKGLYIGHVGDSRAYIINNNGINKITEDHSYVQELINNGGLTENEAMSHPNKNLITRSIGIEEYVVVDTKTLVLEKDDFILMCTDGLNNHVTNEEIKSIVLEKGEDSAEYLVNIANERGGKDNISVIVGRKEGGR